MANLHLLSPEIFLATLALLLMAADLVISPRHGKILYHLTWGAAAVTLCLVGYTISEAAAYQGVGTLWVVDPMSQFFKMLVLLTTILCALMGIDYKQLPVSQSGTFCALLLFSAVGMMFLVSATDILLLFVAIELISISSFILAGFERKNPKSNEGAMKYFLFGAFSSAIMAYGLSLFYGATGTTSLLGLNQSGGATLILSVLLILMGFGFKASIAPMHFWVPDAYEGAPLPVTAFLSLAPKIATMAAALRLFTVLLPAGDLQLTPVLAILAGLTMVIGNFTAIFQSNVKRLLAYSSVAQAGYIMIGIVAGDATGLEGVLLYSFVYVSMNVGAFAVVQAVGDDGSKGGVGSYELSAFDGLGKRSFGLALAMAFFLLSLAGIPPLSGFIGKLYIFQSAFNTQHYGLAVIAVITSVVSVYYYMRIVYHMFLLPARTEEPLQTGPYLYGGLVAALAGVLLFGIFPEPLVASIQASAQYLP
jgi:NADH-quinone oxidoreductase subunit N